MAWIRGPGSAGPVTVGPPPDGPGPVCGWLGPAVPPPPPSGGRGVPRRTRTRRGPNRSPAGPTRPAARWPAARRGGRSAAPAAAPAAARSAAVTRPGTASSTPANRPDQTVDHLRAGRLAGLGGGPEAAPGPHPLAAQQHQRRRRRRRARAGPPKPKPIACATSDEDGDLHDRGEQESPAEASVRPRRRITSSMTRGCITGVTAGVRVLSAVSPAAEQRVPAGPQAPHGDPQQRLADDRRAHLAGAVFPLGEGDRHLDDPEPGPVRPPGQLHLERVALRRRPTRSRSCPAPASCRRGSRRSRRVTGMPEREPDVQVAAAGEQRAGARPVDHLAAGRPPGADHHVGVAGGVEQRAAAPRGRASRRRPSRRRRRTRGRCAQREPGDVRGAEALLAGPVQHVDVVVGGGELVGDRAGAVGAVVVGDQDVDGRGPRAGPAR